MTFAAGALLTAGVGLLVVRAEVIAVALALGAVASVSVLWRPKSMVVPAFAVGGVLLPSMHPALRPPAALTLRWGSLTLFLLVAVALRFYRSPTSPGVRSSSGHLLTMVFIVCASAIWSEVPTVTAGRAVVFTIMIIAVWLYSRSVDEARVVSVLRVTAGVVAVANASAFLAGFVGPLGRFSGAFGNPNTLGVINGLLLPAAFPSPGMPARRALGSYAIPILLITQLLAAGSRGGILAGVAGVLTLEFRRGRLRERTVRLGAIAGAVTAGVLVAPQLLAERLILGERLSSIETRTNLWGLAPALWRQRPVAGAGFGVTERVLAEKASTIGFESEVNFHNSYLNLLIDLGVLGVVVLAAVMLTTLWRSRGHLPQLSGVVAAGLTSAIFESWMFAAGSGLAIYFWLSVAVCLRPPSSRLDHIPGDTVAAPAGDSDRPDALPGRTASKTSMLAYTPPALRECKSQPPPRGPSDQLDERR